MSLMKCVPGTVLCQIFNEWCHLKEIAHFDSAFTNLMERSQLLVLYTRNHINVSIKLNCFSNSNILWCEKKGFIISKLSVSKSPIQFQEIPNSLASTLTYISCHSTAHFVHRSLFSFVNSCGKLAGLSISGNFTAGDLKLIHGNVWEKLETFKIKFFRGATFNLMSLIAQHCKQLTALSVSRCCDSREENVIETIVKNRELKKISFQDNDLLFANATISVLSTNLRNINDVTLNDCSNISIHALMKLIMSAKPQMKKLHINSTNQFGFGYFYGRDDTYNKIIESVRVHLYPNCVYNDIQTSADLMYIFEHLTTVDHITLIGVKHLLSEKMFEFIAETNRNLSRLTVGEKYSTEKLLKIFATFSRSVYITSQ